MASKGELAIVRRAFAKQVMAVFGGTDRRVEKAFATVPREAFLAPGPWQVVRWGRGYATTPSRDPVYLYDDVVVAIDPTRNLNNGQPSLHAWLMAAAAPRAGEHAVHIGTGNGYYTAILAELVGRRGTVTAIEYDAGLAARAARNLAGRPGVSVIHADGTTYDFARANVIYVNAGATHPLPHWIDRLAEGGRLIVPLTEAGFPNGDVRRGAVFRIERQGGGDFTARRISAVAIFPCAGGRDDESAAALAAAFAGGDVENVTRFYRRDDVPDRDCWLKGEGWCLAYR